MVGSLFYVYIITLEVVLRWNEVLKVKVVE